MDGHFVNFQRVYDLLTAEVLTSKSSMLPQHLAIWFERLDNTPGVGSLIGSLDEAVNFPAWKAEREATVKSMVGSGELRWPKERERRLGMQLALFREIAEEKFDAFDFAHNFFYADNNVDDTVSEFVVQVFGPMSRDLRLFLQERSEEAEERPIPAADRIVKLDHNSDRYRDAVGALETLERVLKETNDYPDADDKEQKIAEVSALQRLFQSSRVRVHAVIALAVPGLLYLAKTFANTGVGTAAKYAWEKIGILIGVLF
jgi:hypothetical protein